MIKRATLVNLRFCGNNYDAKIDRTTPFGNPFHIGVGCTRKQAVERYRVWFYDKLQNDPAFKRAVLQLQGKRLACWCTPMFCHGDVIVEYLDEQAADEEARLSRPSKGVPVRVRKVQ